MPTVALVPSLSAPASTIAIAVSLSLMPPEALTYTFRRAGACVTIPAPVLHNSKPGEEVR